MKGQMMTDKLTTRIPNTTKIKILSRAKKSSAHDLRDIKISTLNTYFLQVEDIADLITKEMDGSKNKYLIDLYNALDNNEY